MEEEELTDAIYGDLGDFEFGEKLKEVGAVLHFHNKNIKIPCASYIKKGN